MIRPVFLYEYLFEIHIKKIDKKKAPNLFRCFKVNDIFIIPAW